MIDSAYRWLHTFLSKYTRCRKNTLLILFHCHVLCYLKISRLNEIIIDSTSMISNNFNHLRMKYLPLLFRQRLTDKLQVEILTVGKTFLGITVTRHYTEYVKQGSTIYALSSGQGKCGVAVVRISGKNARDAIRKMTCINELEPRKAVLRKIRDPLTKEIIDNGLCLWFPGPHSFTGEDSVEFHVHGGSAILDALMSALSKLQFRPALQGEFTKRAFHNNKLDLTEIEGLADLIHAETEQQRKQALLQADGSLRKLYYHWRQIMLQNISSLEAYIDFGEEDNIENDVINTCNSSLKSLAYQIRNHLADGRKGEILRNGIRTVIVGEPNVGKSSLLNKLSQRNAAIVTPIAGTTRDVIEIPINIFGYPVILIDTAGLKRETSDIIEAEGICKARTHIQTADLIILVIDFEKYSSSGMTYKDYLKFYIKSLDLHDVMDNISETKFMIIMNKIDLIHTEKKKQINFKGKFTLISCQTEEGFSQMLTQMHDKFKQLCGNPSRENPTISQVRYRNHLMECLRRIENYFNISSISEYDMVIAVQEIRLAMRELGMITGHVTSDEILDVIFKNFCIGK